MSIPEGATHRMNGSFFIKKDRDFSDMRACRIPVMQWDGVEWQAAFVDETAPLTMIDPEPRITGRMIHNTVEPETYGDTIQNKITAPIMPMDTPIEKEPEYMPEGATHKRNNLFFRHVEKNYRGGYICQAWSESYWAECFLDNLDGVEELKKEYIPKVGEWCEIRIANKWMKVRFHGECDGIGYYVFYMSSGDYEELKPADFRPIKSDRDVFIERSLGICRAVQSDSDYEILKEASGIQYDNGARFADE